MKNIKRVIKNQDGLSLIPVLLVSMILVSLLSVWMIQFSNSANTQTADWVQKENYRIGTELAKQVGEAFELYKQQNPTGVGGSCGQGQIMYGTFCFQRGVGNQDSAGGGSGTPTGACATSAMVGNGQTPLCLRVNVSVNDLQEKFHDLDATKMPTFYAEYRSRPRLNLFMSTANAAPQGAPTIPGVTANVATPVGTCTAIDSPWPNSGLCHACGTGGITCYQVAYCSVADPNCASSTPIKMGIMVKTN